MNMVLEFNPPSITKYDTALQKALNKDTDLTVSFRPDPLWLNKDELAALQLIDGFRPFGFRFETTRLWRELLQDHLEWRKCGVWTFTKNEPVWKYEGGSKLASASLRFTVGEALQQSYSILEKLNAETS